MVKFIENIQQNNLPTISNNFFPNPVWSASDSFDYQQYYDKKKGIRSFQQARNKATCKPDENFKVDYGSKNFYNFTDYKTRMNVSKYYYLVHPYCELNQTNPNTTATGTQMFNATIASEGIAGRNETLPIVPGPNQNLTATCQNRVKGAIPFDKCVNFKNGFRPGVQYSFRF